MVSLDAHPPGLISRNDSRALISRGTQLPSGERARPRKVLESRRGDDDPLVVVTRSLSGSKRFEIACDGRAVGHIDVVGNIFVALAGARYDRAVEIRQSHHLNDCIEAVLAASTQDDKGSATQPKPCTGQA